ncbi:hypothetical protein IH992_21595, partial [Candidatus Poribacteria bacterium]|nr:hypothetical protein [Candidatus Poribacteria bacterium]
MKEREESDLTEGAPVQNEVSEHLAKALRQVKGSLSPIGLQLKTQVEDPGQSTHNSTEIDPKSTMAKDSESVKTPSSTETPLSSEHLAKALRQVKGSLSPMENRLEKTDTTDLQLKTQVEDPGQSTHNSTEIDPKSTMTKDSESVKTPSSPVTSLSSEHLAKALGQVRDSSPSMENRLEKT